MTNTRPSTRKYAFVPHQVYTVFFVLIGALQGPKLLEDILHCISEQLDRRTAIGLRFVSSAFLQAAILRRDGDVSFHINSYHQPSQHDLNCIQLL
jgi:hypothetical protein